MKFKKPLKWYEEKNKNYCLSSRVYVWVSESNEYSRCVTPCKLCVTLCCFYRAKNHGRLWRVNACVEYANEVKFIVQHIFRRFWKENSAEERLLTPIICLILKKIELFYSHVTRTCKLVVLFAIEEAFKVFVYFHAVQVSSTNFEISTYGFWICSLADAILMHFTKESVSIVAILWRYMLCCEDIFVLHTCFWLNDSKNPANTLNIFLPNRCSCCNLTSVSVHSNFKLLSYFFYPTLVYNFFFAKINACRLLATRQISFASNSPRDN